MSIPDALILGNKIADIHQRLNEDRDIGKALENLLIARHQAFNLGNKAKAVISADKVVVDREEWESLCTIHANIRIIPGDLFSETTRDIVEIMDYPQTIAAKENVNALRAKAKEGGDI